MKKEQVLTMGLRDTLKVIMKKEVENLPKTLEALEPKDRINVLCKLMPLRYTASVSLRVEPLVLIHTSLKQKCPPIGEHFYFIAEMEGFEPPVPRGTLVFKTSAFDHSATSLFPVWGCKCKLIFS